MSSVHEYVLWLSWGLLTLVASALKNPVHDLLFPTQDVMENLLSDMTFAPGLLDALLSKLPPTIDFFKSLPTHPEDSWGVYLIALEKAACRPRIYIRSATGQFGGFSRRFKDYKYLGRMPQYVKKAVDEGYAITYKGVLCWTTIPTASLRFQLRSLILILETVFSLAFWAMKSRSKTYGMPSLLSWTLDDVQYDGCCGHTAIGEMVWGETEGLTVDQIAAKQAEMDIRRKEQDKLTRQRYYARRNAADFEGWRQRKNAQLKKSNDKMRGSKKFACAPCGMAFASQFALNTHKSRDIHITRVSGVKKSKVYKAPDQKRRSDELKSTKTHYCAVCDASFASKSALDKHNNGPKHIKRAAEAASPEACS
jgi:hypothetical protein